MAKTRLTIPNPVREAVLKEFNHRCAICGRDRPQIHHIDENPSNNDLFNLISLCPNCHLVDQHNPTSTVDSAKLRLFREFKDPTILKPEFHPLFSRVKYLSSIPDDAPAKDLEQRSRELVDFVAALEMGSFYSKRLERLVSHSGIWAYHLHDEAHNREIDRQRAEEYREKLRNAKDEVFALVVELLRFQKW